MTYNAIRRGPMGGDQYTQIHNGVFRDTRLSPQAMAVFGHLSTHTNGWLTSVRGIARSMNLGEGTVKAALARLKKHHYLVYGQDRRPDGKVQQGWYFFTDLPAQLEAAGVADEHVVQAAVSRALADWRSQFLESMQVAPVVPEAIPALTSGNVQRLRAL